LVWAAGTEVEFLEVRGSSDEPKALEMDFDLEVGVTGLVGFEAGSELPSLVRFFLRNPREGIG
jgi:hypothetical protein